MNYGYNFYFITFTYNTMNREEDIINSTSYPSPTNYISKEEVLKESNNLIETIKKTKDKKI